MASPSENDPERIADLLIRLTQADSLPKRLILGKAAKTYVEQVEAARADEMDANRALTLSTIAPDRAVTGHRPSADRQRHVSQSPAKPLGDGRTAQVELVRARRLHLLNFVRSHDVDTVGSARR